MIDTYNRNAMEFHEPTPVVSSCSFTPRVGLPAFDPGIDIIMPIGLYAACMQSLGLGTGQPVGFVVGPHIPKYG